MRSIASTAFAVVAAVVVAGCGGGNGDTTPTISSTTRGALLENPPIRVASLTAAAVSAQLQASTSGQQLQAIAGTPACGVDAHYFHYATVGGAGEATTASGALMVPTGAAGTCSGARPIVLYAHGTTTDRRFNIADITNAGNGEGLLLAALYAAQGYIVIAPNFAGYDSSPLPYHPFLNADQQSKDMIDALTAARLALGHIPAATTTDNGKLFITGYSQGGHVAMATHRAMQAAGTTVTASAPSSGPYAIAAQFDANFFGAVSLGSTQFTPLLFSMFKNSYPATFTLKTTDVFEPAYSNGIDTLLPSTTPIATLFAENKLPPTALFNSTPPSGTGSATLDALFPTITPATTPAAEAPLFALGFGTNDLITNAFRAAYVGDALVSPDGVFPTATTGLPAANPTNPMRVAIKANDLRGWTPAAPVLLCGGDADPVIYYAMNTGTMATLWSPFVTAGLVTVLDVDATTPSTNPGFAALQAGFQKVKAATSVAAGGGAAGANAVIQAYHGTLVPPFCAAAARGFFSHF